ncbi:KinB-signaling pathway activation protein [Bacillus sp. 2205SS5-2]|uniref:KinB-signaling pathway activation protein n=1 Tax=Bacillus sp. 2205SS5-2 TaxID=3109031 RepID=UPI00300798D9
MTIRNWIKFFFSTLFLGGVVHVLFGFVIRWSEFSPWFSEMSFGEIIPATFWLLGVGFTFSVISQMGFFAYLTIHQFGVGFFKSISLWNSVQLVIIALVLFDLVYFRFQKFAGENESIVGYFLLAMGILAYGLVVAYFKSKQTKNSTFVSALFFMTVVTILEWIPVLTANEKSWLFQMLFTLLVCNTYQLLMLPKYIQRKA